jgi:hypothetical protein
MPFSGATPYYPQSYGYVPPLLKSPLARGQAPARPPVVRGQAPEEKPIALKLPPPEELGITLKRNDAPLDWNALRQQLDQLGAASFQLDKHGSGYRFACQLRGRSVEGFGATEGDAVRTALARIRQ